MGFVRLKQATLGIAEIEESGVPPLLKTLLWSGLVVRDAVAARWLVRRRSGGEELCRGCVGGAWPGGGRLGWRTRALVVRFA